MMTTYNPIRSIKNLGSSSSGNCFHIEIVDKNEKPYNLLVECGFPYKTIMDKAVSQNIKLSELNAILITHEHKDHAMSCIDFNKRGIPIYAPQEVFTKYELTENVFPLKDFTQTKMSDSIKVFGLPLEHLDSDGSNIKNLGYVITIDDEFRIAFFIDTPKIEYDLSKYQFDIIFIEANNLVINLSYAIKENLEKIKDTTDGVISGKHEHKLRHFERVMKSHLTVERVVKILKTWDLTKTKTIILTHLTSDTKVYETTIIKAVKDGLKIKKRPKVLCAIRQGGFME